MKRLIVLALLLGSPSSAFAQPATPAPPATTAAASATTAATTDRAPANAQTTPQDDAAAVTLTPVTLGFDYGDAFLRDLPLSDSLYPVLETMQPSLITDRFTNGGLFNGQAARVGGFQASWSQTRFLLGDVDISDPTGTGAPLLFPDLSPWQRIRVATGMIGSDVNSTGLAISLDPRVAGATWRHAGDAFFSHGALAADPSSLPEPTIARLGGRDRLAWSGSGPLGAATTGAFTASWTKTSQYDRAETSAVDASIGSLFGSVVRSLSNGGRLESIGWLQHGRAPLAYRQVFGLPGATTGDTSVHVQSTWHNPVTTAWLSRIFAAYSQRTRTPDADADSGLVERMIDGPVWTTLSAPRGTVRQWTLGARSVRTPEWRGATHNITGGLDIVGASQHTPISTVRTIGELTDGVPSRVWSFRNPESASSRGSLTVSAHASDVVRLSSKLTGSAGLRLEFAHGSASGAAEGIQWISLLPRARLDWRLHEQGHTVAFLGYTRSATRLALDLLAFGDPNAPWATVYRWDPRFSTPVAGVTSIVARVGPGSAGATDFVRVDSGLKRPVSDELSFGFEMRPSARSRFQLAAVGRRESGFMALTNVGAPITDYSATFVNDPGANTGSPADDKVIPVYERRVGSFGNDRYLLTNPGLQAAWSGSLELSGQLALSRLTFYGGATASYSIGPAAALGYGPLENDQSVVSETYITPNADPFRRGRLFNDRAFTIKLSTVYRLPADIKVGAIARYQDGQNFSRVLVFPNLAQGAEAVRAFAAGDSRFRFIAGLDLRLSKAFTVNGRQLEVVVDGFNVTGLHYDVEERAGQAPNDRTPIALQPTRSLQVGLRVGL